MYIAQTSMVPLWQKTICSRFGGVADELCTRENSESYCGSLPTFRETQFDSHQRNENFG
jgi:hypothetical protein